MKNALKYAVLALGPIILIVGIVLTLSGGKEGIADSVLVVNLYTLESDRIPVGDMGRSVLADDQGRRVRFMVEGEDGGADVSPGEPMFIRESDRYTFDKYVREGKIDAEQAKVDPETYRILQ
jgi:hypothetical protein